MIMNLWIILGVIATVLGGAWAGVSNVAYDANGQLVQPWLSWVPRFPSASGAPAQTVDGTAMYDWSQFIGTNPLQTVVTDIEHASGQIMDWIAGPLQWIFVAAVGLACPTCQLPAYSGLLISVLIFLIMMFFTYEWLIGFIGKFTIIALVIVSLIILLVVMLSWFGVH